MLYKIKQVYVLQKTHTTQYDSSEINDIVGVFSTKGQAQNEMSKIKNDWLNKNNIDDYTIEKDDLSFYAYNDYDTFELKITKWSIQ